VTREVNSERAVAFLPTEWSMVLQAGSDSAQREQALTRLYKTYWLPLYGYARRRGFSPQDAEDLVQGFFAYLLEADFLDRPDPAKGRFRSYLLGALRQYIAKHIEREQAQKRGGGARRLELDDVDAEQEFAMLDPLQLDPADAFEKTWALTLLGQALKRLNWSRQAAVSASSSKCSSHS
jgi:RNA polymerase sigma-70 factor (ECF subfamily)